MTLPKQWTIETRGVISDPEAQKAFEDVVRAAADIVCHAMLIAHEAADSGPVTVVYSDDFYTGHEEIKLNRQIDADLMASLSQRHAFTGPELVGKRVELPVHYDNWMRGARTGKVTSYRPGNLGSAYVNVKLDHPKIKRLQKVWKLDWHLMKVMP